MSDKDITAQEARLVEAYRSILGRDPWLADMVLETVLDVARTSPTNAGGRHGETSSVRSDHDL